jgi:hypothetical protein
VTVAEVDKDKPIIDKRVITCVKEKLIYAAW